MSDEWQFLVTLNERLRPLQDPSEIQDVAVRLIGEHLDASQVHYARIDGHAFVIEHSYVRDAARSSASRDAAAHVGERVVEACRRGETVVVDGVGTDSRFTGAERAQLLPNGITAFVCVPLIKHGHCVGTFTLHSESPRHWTDDQIALIEITAERAWSAGARALAEEALTRSGDRQAFMRSLNDAIAPLADPIRILGAGCQLLGRYLRVNRVIYAEVDGDHCELVNDYVDGVPSMAGRYRWSDFVGSRRDSIFTGTLVVAADTSTASGEERDRLRAADIGAYVSAPVVKDGRFLGAFSVHSREPRAWTADEIALVQDVADRLWATIEHRKAEIQLRENEDRLAFLLRLNDALRPLSDAGDVQETAARLLGQHLGVTRVVYAEIEGRDYSIRREYANGVPPLAGMAGRTIMNADMLATLRRGETVVVNDVQSDPRLSADNRHSLLSRQMSAFMMTALIKQGRLVANLGANHIAPRVWTASEITLLTDVAERTWDAVERTRTESALRDQQQRLQLALEASGGGSWTWDAVTNQSYWDERFRALYGFTADEPATTSAWMPRVHEDDRARIMADLHDIMMSKTRTSWQNTLRIVRPDGTVAWIQSRGRADRDADGNVTRLTGLDLDFNDHHRLEEAREARRDEEHDRTLRTLLETATQGIVSVDANGVIVSANRALESMFGWTTGALIGTPVERLMPTAFRETSEPRDSLDLIGVRRDGSRFPIEVRINRVAAPGGGHTFAFVTDITERQRAASALRERTAELEYRTTQLSRMASDLTLAEQRAREQIAGTLHDGLQQMLVIAAMNLEQQLKRDAEHGAVVSGLLTEARRQLEKAIAAARSLNVELFPPVLQQSGLPAALAWLAKWMQEKYRLEVIVTTDPRADSPRKEVRTLLFESVRELLFNVVKHANALRVTLDLTLEADDQLSIAMVDAGIGFDPADVERRSKAGQVGWGLFSIRERLTLLGGRFEIQSAPGQGTRVRLVAPRGEAQRPAAKEDPALPTVDTPPSSVDRTADTRLKILLVDDHPMVRKTFRDMLSLRAQLSIVGDASNGFEAIALAHALQPDVILMDIGMPHMDGIEATRRIHADLPAIEILGLSMQPRSAAAEAMQQAGAAAFFAKGTDTVRLTEHLLALHDARSAARVTKS